MLQIVKLLFRMVVSDICLFFFLVLISKPYQITPVADRLFLNRSQLLND